MSFRTAIARFSAAAIVTAAASLSVDAQANSNTLYKRIGGYDAIAAVTDDFVGRLVNDPLIAPFFKGHSQTR